MSPRPSSLRPLGPAVDPRRGDADVYEWFTPITGLSEAGAAYRSKRQAWEAEHPPWFDPRNPDD